MERSFAVFILEVIHQLIVILMFLILDLVWNQYANHSVTWLLHELHQIESRRIESNEVKQNEMKSNQIEFDFITFITFTMTTITQFVPRYSLLVTCLIVSLFYMWFNLLFCSSFGLFICCQGNGVFKVGQKYPTPAPANGDRVFYESLLIQVPTRYTVIIFWMFWMT